MNFTPFGNTFPGNIPGLPQFTTSTAPLVSTVTAAVADVTVTTTNNPQQQQQQQQQDAAGPSNRYQQQQVTHFGQANLATGQSGSGNNKFRGGQEDALQGDKYNGHLVTAAQQQQQQQQTQYATVAYASATTTSAAADALQASTSGQQQQQQMQQQQVTAPQELTQDLCNAILQQQGTLNQDKKSSSI